MPDQIADTTTDTTTNRTTGATRRFQCRHIFIDGHRCGSPALRREEFCYYHHTARRTAADLRIRRNRMDFELPPIEDRSSILTAVTEVLQRIASGGIHGKRAGLLLYGLQIASRNLPKSCEAKPDDQPIEEIITHPRFGEIAPVVEIGELAEPSITSGQISNEPDLDIPSPDSETQPGAPSPDSGTWVSTSTPQNQPDAPSPQSGWGPGLQPQYPTETPQAHPPIKAPRLLRRFVDFDIPKSVFYKPPTPEPTEAEPAILPNLQATALCLSFRSEAEESAVRGSYTPSGTSLWGHN